MSLPFFPRFSDRRRASGSSRRARRARVSQLPMFEGLEDRISLTSDVWTG